MWRRAYSSLSFSLNGKAHRVVNPDPRQTLLEYLRSIALTGTKLGCGEGGCGACTVMVSTGDQERKAVNACLAPLCSVDGMAVTTVDGIGSVRDGLDEVQDLVSSSFGSQCGFCTPGIVMAIYTYRQAHPQASAEEVAANLDGNLCRCTGYRPIVDAIYRLPKASSAPVMLPPGVAPATTAVEIGRPEATWHRPVSLTQLLQLKDRFPESKIVVGNTEIGIETKFKGLHYPYLISPALVPELHVFRATDTDVTIGAALSLTHLEAEFEHLNETLPRWKTEGVRAVLYQLRWFASNQIRNVACIGGNIATASPISDLNPAWIALGASVELASAANGRRTVSMRDFFLGYRKTALRPDEVIVSLRMPLSREGEYALAFKQARRKEDDIAIVTAVGRVLLRNGFVAEAGLGFGGMAAKSVFAANAERALVGRPFDAAAFESALQALEKELALPADAVGGMAGFRSTLAASFLLRFQSYVQAHSGGADDGKWRELDHDAKMRGEQVYTSSVSELKPVTFPVMHLSAQKQVTGEAIFVDDIPNPRRGLHAHLVLSTKASASFSAVDASAALKMPGVVGFFSAKDIPGHNEIGPTFKGEELFASSEVMFVGHPIGVIVAESHNQAREAAQKVVITWKEEKKPILTIAEAIAAKSFFPPSKSIDKGDAAAAIASAPHVVEGEMAVGAQEHFYLEPQGSFVVPGEEFEVFASTQNPTHTQHVVAEVLGMPANRVVTKTRRLGGGFGGKETRSMFVSAACAVAAYHLRQPVRMILDRDIDFATSGARHAFKGKYRVGFDERGVLRGVETQLYSNAGYSIDLSFSIMERALFHSLNSYKCDNVRVTGQLCRTNIVTATAFRGFGGPQGMMVVEAWVDHVARTLGLAPETVRERNFIRGGDLTHYNQKMEESMVVADMFAKLKRDCDFDKRKAEIEAFNSSSRYHKRGICLLPTVFGLAFTFRTLNQAGALVNVFTDGTVQVNQGGTEMGQGLFTKMAQIAAHALGVPIDKIVVMETSTDKVPNTSPTAASVQTDVNGAAVLDACSQLVKRLAPIRAQFPNKSFAELCQEAHFQRISLSAQGFYRTPELEIFDFNRKVEKSDVNRPFNYFTEGVACTEVELDSLSGDFVVRRTDILMDVGKSINPGLDVGQVEGAFVQGMGWCTMEELAWMKSGTMFTRGPGAYKIPGFADTPRDFRVALLQNNPNIRAVHSSKGIGEPPLFLGASVLLALKEAVYAARREAGLAGHFQLASPATAERLRMACGDALARRYQDVPHDEFVLPN